MLTNRNTTGPVTRAIAAMRSSDPHLPAVSNASADDPDLDQFAEEYLAFCHSLGMFFTVGVDGALWRGMSVTFDRDCLEMREHLTSKLSRHPRLKQAVVAAIRRGA